MPKLGYLAGLHCFTSVGCVFSAFFVSTWIPQTQLSFLGGDWPAFVFCDLADPKGIFLGFPLSAMFQKRAVIDACYLTGRLAG